MMLERAWLDNLKIHDVGELATIEYGIQNTTLGNGPTPDVSSQRKSRQHGSVNRTRFYQPFAFALNGLCHAGDPAQNELALEELRRVLNLDGTPIVFRFRRYGWTFDERMEVVPNGELQAPSAGWEPIIRWGVSLEAPDPRKYAYDETSATWDPTMIAQLGIHVPLHSPIHLAGTGAQTTDLVVTAGGTIETPPTFTVHGPATYLAAIDNNPTGESIVFQGTAAGPLTATDEVVVDVASRSITLNGADQASWIDAELTTWFELAPGVDNAIRLRGSGFSVDATTDMVVTFRDART